MAHDRRRESPEQFLARRGQGLMRTAVLLTGSAEAAEDLLQTALERLLRQWRHVDGDPEGYTGDDLFQQQTANAPPGRDMRAPGAGPPDALPGAGQKAVSRSLMMLIAQPGTSRTPCAAPRLRVFPGATVTSIPSLSEIRANGPASPAGDLWPMPIRAAAQWAIALRQEISRPME